MKKLSHSWELLLNTLRQFLFPTRGKLFHALGWGCKGWGLSRRGGGVGGAECGSPTSRTVVCCRRFLCEMECWKGMVGECAEDEELVEDEEEFLRSRRIGFWWRIIDSIYWRQREEGRGNISTSTMTTCIVNEGYSTLIFLSNKYSVWNEAQMWGWLSWQKKLDSRNLRSLQWDTGRGCPCLSPSSPSPAVFSVPLSPAVLYVAVPPSAATQPNIHGT